MVLLCSRSTIMFWAARKMSPRSECAWLCVHLRGDHGAQRENTQSRLSAQPGPAAHSAPTFTAYIAYLTVVNDVIQTWINRRAKVKGRSKLFFKPCPMSHFLLLKLGHKQTCICIWKSQDDHTRTIPVKRMPPEALVLPSQLEDNLVRLTILLVKQQQMKGKIIIIIMKHLFHHSCFLQSSMVLDFCSSKIDI